MWHKEHYLALVGLQCVHKNMNPLYMNLYTCKSTTQWNAVYTQREKLIRLSILTLVLTQEVSNLIDLYV